MTIPELLDTLIIHPSGLIEMPMGTFDILAAEVPSQRHDYCGYRGDFELMAPNVSQCPECGWITLGPTRIQEMTETEDLLIQEGL